MSELTRFSQRPFDSGDDLPPMAAGTIASVPGDSSLDGLRARLVTARTQRGNCPDLIELQQDHLPTIESREGREDRARHFERCAVCHHQIHAWKNSLEGRVAYALALSQVIAHHLSVGAKRTARMVSRPKKEKPPRPAPELVVSRSDALPLPSRPMPVPTVAPPMPVPTVAPPMPTPVQARTEVEAAPVLDDPRAGLEPAPARDRSPKSKKHASAETLPPLLVLEAPPPGVVPKALLLAVAERGGAVVTLPNVEEVFADPDFGAVRVLVLARSRPLAEWPGVIQRVRDKAPGRIVLAVVPVPRFGPASVNWGRDPSIMIPPVSEKDWGPALDRGGWAGRR